MRILNGVFTLLLILFAAVQYNDPDGLFWAVVYGVGVIWCGLAALAPQVYRTLAPFALWMISAASAIAGMVYFWPRTPNFWLQDVWWETETAREGMGMMVLVIALAIAGFVVLRTRRAA